MCGRYSLAQGLKELSRRFGLEEFAEDIPPRYNLAPLQQAPVIFEEKKPRGLQRTLRLMRWGLGKMGSINARSETLSLKPSFRSSFLQRRCLVPADGFYEWTQSKRMKTPVRFVLKSREPFAFAGIREGGSFAVVTTEANSLIAPLHERMPAILSPKNEAWWLDPEVRDPDFLSRLLSPYPSEDMESFEVSPIVNSPKNDGPECILPFLSLF